MQKHAEMNAKRFTGFADVYDEARPAVPGKVPELLEGYLGGRARTVVDLGCGTGLSTQAWAGRCKQVLGVEPSDDMRREAEKKNIPGARFIAAFAANTTLETGCADIVVCSQSFHWMEPKATLAEVGRILRPGGVFATVDCDWPPVCHWQAELAYQSLFAKVAEVERAHKDLQDSYVRWPKSGHLANIRESGQFRYVRELLMMNREKATRQRLVGLVRSQGGLQLVQKACPGEVQPMLEAFEASVNEVYANDAEFEIGFCYRIRLGIK